jgi:hypothetical protein
MAKKTEQWKLDGMVAAYESGMTAKVAAAKYGCSQCVCLRELKRKAIPARTGSWVPKSRLDIAVAAYDAGANMTEAGRVIGCSDIVLRKELKRRGVELKGFDYKRWRKYGMDETFFDIIDTEEKAYWIGFITADGSVCKNNLSVGLAAVDKDHLNKLRDSLKADCPIKDEVSSGFGKGLPMVRIRICSNTICTALSQHGVVPNKTLKETYCTNIPDLLVRHYWRGLVDGDGCITRSDVVGTDRSSWQVQLVGSKDIVCSFSRWVRSFVVTSAEPKESSKTKGYYSIRYSGIRIVQAITDALYKESAIHLDRKKLKADELLCEVVRYPKVVTKDRYLEISGV